MLARLVLSVVVAVVVTLGCILLGTILSSVNLSIAAAIGAFLLLWATVFGILAALWYYFAGGGWPTFKGPM